jgi:transposase
VHGVDANGATVLHKQLRRGQVVAFFAGLPRCLVGLEACATAHYWGRELQAVGHEVRLMPAQYVKAYVQRNKNDAADAWAFSPRARPVGAICEAVSRPSMRFVAIKTAEQQAALLLHRGRERLARQRTSLVNALRAHLAEFGVIAPPRLRHVARLVAIVRDESDTRLPDLARRVLQVLATQLEQLAAAVAAIEKQLMAWHRNNPASQRLASIPGIGPIIATALAATVVEPIGFASGREFAAWLGLVPRQHSTGGKARPRRHLQARQPVLAASADQRCQRQSTARQGNQRRSVGHRAAPPAAKPGRCGGLGQQDGAHRLGGDAPRGELPASVRGGIDRRATGWGLREDKKA